MTNDILKSFNEFLTWLESYPYIEFGIKAGMVLLVSLGVYFIAKGLAINIIKKFVSKTKTKLDDHFLDAKLLRRIAYLIPIIIINASASLFPFMEGFVDKVTKGLFIFFFLLVLSQVLTSITTFLEATERFKDRPIKGYVQVIKVILFAWGIILMLGVFTTKDPWAIVGGLSALTAVIILVFRDTILSFVASIQISSYDLIKKGDWIEVPKYGADGDVIDISLNVIKVQNWDKTITVIPTYKIIDDTFKNWRGMVMTGGRRIARSIYIDMSSIKFCDDKMIEKYKKIELIRDYVEKKLTEIEDFNKSRNFDRTNPVNGRWITNVGTFRAYLKEYLHQREDIHKGLTFLVRQLEPNDKGLPIQIYVFANTTVWGKYEDIQGDIFDHIFAVIPFFDLRIYQSPTGSDIKALGKFSFENQNEN